MTVRHEPDTSEQDRRLTDETFWDSFWMGVPLPARPSTDSRFDRSFIPVLDRYLSRSAGRMLEVGCAPGRWMLHCRERYGMEVEGYESSPVGVQATRSNLELSGARGVVHEIDFLTADLPRARYDAVLSLGFIEHFLEPADVVRRHAAVLKPGGLLFLEVPNLRGITLRLLRWTDSPLLATHNLEVMAPSVLTHLARSAGLDRLEGGYLGGYEPGFVDLRGRAAPVRAVFSAVSRLRRMHWLDRVNAPFLSGYLYGVYRKPQVPVSSAQGDT